MTKILYIMIAAVALVVSTGEASAQMGKREYINLGWKFNGSVGNNFVKSAQGYGAYLEAGYYLTPHLAVGAFAEVSTNNEYFPRATYIFEDQSALTSSVDRSLYQLPFGASLRYRCMWREIQPYFTAKIGAEYSTQSTYLSTYMNRNENWGFYVSPEIGIAFFPFPKTDLGFQVAAYYSYSTNRNSSSNLNGLNNVGFKLGLAF